MWRPCPKTSVLREGKQTVCETVGSHRPEMGYHISFPCPHVPAGTGAKRRGLAEDGLCSTPYWGKLRPSGCPWLKPDAEPILFPALTHRSWEEQGDEQLPA